MDPPEDMDEKETDVKYRAEKVIADIGGCGLYQIRLFFIIHSMKFVSALSIYAMVFLAKVPEWRCADDIIDGNTTRDTNDTWTGSCINDNGTPCTRFQFKDDMNTIVSEWSLVCDDAYIPSTLASVNMAGLFVGNIFSGHLADAVGRKIPLYISLVILIVFSVIAFFTSSWIQFAIVRFFLGVGVGFFFTLQYTIQSEIALSRWRTPIVTVPSWYIEMCLFALVAWAVHDWAYIHLITALVGLPFLLTWWFVPESFRWYVAHGKIHKAKNVIKTIATTNKRPTPDEEALTAMIMTDTHSSDDVQKKYSAIDLFSTRHLARISVLNMLNWLTLGLITYSVQFAISALSGSIYFNIFLFGVVLMPSAPISILLSNTIGRRKNAILLYGIAAVGAIGVGIVQYIHVETQLRNRLTNGLALVAYLGINACWSPVQMLTIETYPTVIRNIGYGFQNTIARVGAVIGPQIAFLDTRVPGLMYFISGGLAVACILSTISLPETMNSALNDKLGDTKIHKEDRARKAVGVI